LEILGKFEFSQKLISNAEIRTDASALMQSDDLLEIEMHVHDREEYEAHWLIHEARAVAFTRSSCSPGPPTTVDRNKRYVW